MAQEVVSIDDRDFLRLLKALPPELVSKRGGPVLAGLRRGGNAMRKYWRQEIDRIDEAMHRLLPLYPEDRSRAAAAQLRRLGVTVRTGARIVGVQPPERAMQLSAAVNVP